MGLRIRSPKAYIPYVSFKRPKRRKPPREPMKNYDRLAYIGVTRDDSFKSVSQNVNFNVSLEKLHIDNHITVSERRIFGPNIPGWRLRILQGQSATTSADCTRTNHTKYGWFNWLLESKQDDGSGHDITETTTMQGSYIDSPSIASISLNDGMDDQAKAAFIRKARNAQSSMLGGEFMKDVHKTLSSFNRVRRIFLRSLLGFTETATSLRAEFLSTHKKGYKDIRGYIDRASSNWLEYYYGIAPTVSDLENAGFGLWRAYKRTQHGIDNTRIRGFSRQISLSSRSFAMAAQTTHSPNYPRVYADVVVESTKYVAYYGGIRLQRADDNSPVGSGFVNVVNELGLNLKSFVPTLWEIIPYSFVFDYFTNAGSIVSALAFPRSDVLWTNYIVRNEDVTRISYRKGFAVPPPGKITADSFYQHPGEFRSVRYLRLLYDGSLVPTFRWHLPYRDTDWLGILSLIAQKLPSP